MSTPRSRVVWRVLADPPENSAHFVETWYETAAEAVLLARAMAADGIYGVEVNRVVLKPKVSKLDLLNRRGFIDDSDVVPESVWMSPGNHSRRAKRGGKS